MGPATPRSQTSGLRNRERIIFCPCKPTQEETAASFRPSPFRLWPLSSLGSPGRETDPVKSLCGAQAGGGLSTRFCPRRLGHRTRGPGPVCWPRCLCPARARGPCTFCSGTPKRTCPRRPQDTATRPPGLLLGPSVSPEGLAVPWQLAAPN